MATVAQDIRPPVASIGVLGWLRKNLFSTWYNTLLTLVALGIIYLLARGVLGFLAGAEWNVIAANLRLFMVGRYPLDQIWRVELVV